MASSFTPSPRLPAVLQQLEAPAQGLPALAREFAAVFHELVSSSSEQFLATPVRALPTGDERGRFLALDLGGTNLRVGVVRLCGKEERERVEIVSLVGWEIPERLKSGPAEALFAWVAERIGDAVGAYLAAADGAEREEVSREGMELGITFSFPMEQTTHDTALLMPMGKGFTSTTTNDLSSLIRAAYSALQATTKSTPTSASPSLPLPDLEIVAITNDTVSTLLSAAYLHTDARTAAGIIAGTGTNATCLCPTSKLPSFKRPPSTNTTTTTSAVLLNTEWSINGTAAPLAPYQTIWDKLLDEENEKPGFQPLEQMVGGRYLGELVRLIALDIFSPPPSSPDLQQRQRQNLPRKMTTPYALDTKMCSQVEAAADNDDLVLSYLREYFSDDPEFEWDHAAAECFRSVCVAVSTRAAALVAAATVGLLCLNDELEGGGGGDDVLVCYAGTVMEKYPRFRERCEGFVAHVVDSWRDGARAGNVTVRFVEAKDGGILGAAVLAAMVKDGRT